MGKTPGKPCRRIAHRSAPAGLSIVELLVVVAILAALLGLLVPAVQWAREAVRATTCQNQVLHIGRAFQHHNETRRMYPTGGNEWWTPPNFIAGSPAIGLQQDASWAFQILPYLEEKTAWSPPGADDADRQAAAIAAKIPGYFCPSRRGPQSIRYASVNYMDGRELTHGLIDYAASNFQGDGVMVQAGSDREARPRRAVDLTDGLSKTILVGEKRLNLAHLGEWQQDDNEGYTAGWDEDTIRRTDLEPQRDYHGDEDGEERFGSSHASTFSAVFADGSIHVLAYDIDPTVFSSLGNIRDGRSVSDF